MNLIKFYLNKLITLISIINLLFFFIPSLNFYACNGSIEIGCVSLLKFIFGGNIITPDGRIHLAFNLIYFIILCLAISSVIFLFLKNDEYDVISFLFLIIVCLSICFIVPITHFTNNNISVFIYLKANKWLNMIKTMFIINTLLMFVYSIINDVE